MSTGEWEGRLTLAAIALEAGVSAPTVSKVINGRYDVSASTRAKILTILARTGYESPLRQRKYLNRRKTVEVVLDSLNSAYATEVITGVLDHAASSDVEVLLTVTGMQRAVISTVEKRAQRFIDEGRCGQIVVTTGLDAAELEVFRRLAIPMVVIDSYHLPPADVVSIGATNWAGGKDATSHLLELGHRRIAYIGGPDEAECNQARMHGYMAALRAHGLSIDDRYIHSGAFRPDHGANSMKSLLQLTQPPTAIFAASDSIALGVLAESGRRNISVPNELSLVGFDGTQQAVDSVPALTSVTQPLQEIGRTAVQFILRQMNGEVLNSTRVELATHLVVRESTAPPQEHSGTGAN